LLVKSYACYKNRVLLQFYCSRRKVFQGFISLLIFYLLPDKPKTRKKNRFTISIAPLLTKTQLNRQL